MLLKPMTNTGGGGGSSEYTIQAKSVDYEVTGGWTLVQADASGGDVNITLPDPSANSGQPVIVKKTDNSANVVNVLPNVAETIDGAASEVIEFENQSRKFVSDGTNWNIVG
jgi:hypothetical protein